MATFQGTITFNYEVRHVKDKAELDQRLDALIDLFARRSNDLEGVNWDDVDWTAEEIDDACMTCGDLIAGGNPFSTQCDTCLDKEAN